jgi:hypothetical protein
MCFTRVGETSFFIVHIKDLFDLEGHQLACLLGTVACLYQGSAYTAPGAWVEVGTVFCAVTHAQFRMRHDSQHEQMVALCVLEALLDVY